MLNMKKLIDETDFDNLDQLTNNWKQPQHKPQHPSTCPNNRQPPSEQSNMKQNNSYISNQPSRVQPQPEVGGSQKVGTKKRNVIPQVIDEDTEHFKNKLQHLLNNFKVDAVSEFMSMKKDMLDYQKECVKSDTHKYLTMYEQKHQQLLHTKEKLLSVSGQAEKKTIQVQLLSEHIGKLNNRLRTVQNLSVPFAVLYKNKQHEKMMKFKMKQAKVFDQKRLKRKSLWGWSAQYRQSKEKQNKIQSQERIQTEVNEIVGRFQKQMDMLRQQLQEATRKNQQYENNKIMIQENLKKAFLRGVTAMNMEAMGVLGDNAEEDQWASQRQDKDNYTMRSNKDGSYSATNMSYLDHTKVNPNSDSYHQNQSMLVGASKNTINASQISNQNNKGKQIMMISQPKSQSKNHKWKEAPIMGIEQKNTEEQPRMQVVRPTTQGKVIKVVDGKSAVQSRKSGHQSNRNSIGANRKKY